MTELKFALSIEEAADYTGIGRNTLRNLVEWEKLPILRVGRKILIRRERLDEFLILNEGKDLRDRHAVKAVKGGLSTLFQTNFFRLFFRYCTGV